MQNFKPDFIFLPPKLHTKKSNQKLHRVCGKLLKFEDFGLLIENCKANV